MTSFAKLMGQRKLPIRVLGCPGLDIAKSVFQVHGVDAAGQVILRRQLKRRWMRARIPENEPARLVSLRALDLLDTEPEERFDRITRVATALFNVPMATITLVDERRQWFKSCQGTAGREDPRDASFCAHVVSNEEPMVVVDTLGDERFADNPLVLGGPRIRFYAGYPLTLDDGSCVGTLCLLDTRPRTFEGLDLKQLRDLALIVVEQFQVSKFGRVPLCRGKF